MDKESKLVIVGLIAAVVFVVVGVVALGFANETLDVIARLFGMPDWEVWFPPLPDCGIPGLGQNVIATLFLGVGFTVLVLVVTFAVMRLVTRRRKPSAEGPSKMP